MTQLALPLSFPPDGHSDDFVVSTSNARAATGVERWSVWPVMTALLVGPRKSGRSTLARLFERQTGGTVIDDAERHGEAALFHAWFGRCGPGRVARSYRRGRRRWGRRRRVLRGGARCVVH